jgi:hypothetical protein
VHNKTEGTTTGMELTNKIEHRNSTSKSTLSEILNTVLKLET